MSTDEQPGLSDLERKVMQVVWDGDGVTAEQVRTALAQESPMKDSTARTILRRLGEKGFVEYSVQRRTYVYTPRVGQANVAAGAVAGIIDKFCAGSVEKLLLGLVDSKVLSSAKLKQLADRIARAESTNKRTGRGKGGKNGRSGT